MIQLYDKSMDPDTKLKSLSFNDEYTYKKIYTCIIEWRM